MMLNGLCSLFPYRFIENYGTHIITSVIIGGKDVIYVKQHSSSALSAAEIKNYIQDIGDHRFSHNDSHNSGPIKLKDKVSIFSLVYFGFVILMYISLFSEKYLLYIVFTFSSTTYLVMYSTKRLLLHFYYLYFNC
jgi:MAC/Perforin domain